MPKIRTNRGAAKRFTKTASGRIKRHKSHASHILTKKNRKRKRNLRRPALIAHGDEAAVRKMLPHL
jgi:large subunit ribosomal protein L35